MSDGSDWSQFLPVKPARSRSRLRRIKQITDAHCGPATLQMLLDSIGFQTTQEAIVEAAGIKNTIDEDGMRIDHMARAVRLVAPDAALWAKEHTTKYELEELVEGYGYAVGVEWQNLFYDTIQEELDATNWHPEHHDYGHYSVVSHVSIEADEIVTVDPYFEFNEPYRYFSLAWFESRWWDYNEIRNPISGYAHLKKDIRLSFIVTPKGMPFPKVIGMRPIR